MLRSRHRALAIAAGFLAGPLMMIVFARTIALVYGIERTANARSEAALAGTREIAAAIDGYRRRHHRVPPAEEGLAALTPEFLQRIPHDPWGRPFVYTTTGRDFADVLSYGADGEASGARGAADISGRYGRLGSRPPQWLRRAAALLIVTLPLATFALALLGNRLWAADALRGAAVFWSALLAATVGTNFTRSPLPALALLACLACLTGTLAAPPRPRDALLLTFAALIAVQIALMAIVVI